MEDLSNTCMAQLALFCLVGMINTLLDIVLYNLLTGPGPRLSRVQANFCSTTLAMLFSFVLNWVIVFRPPQLDVPGSATRFAVVTLFALYGLQPAIIHLASHWWTGPARWAVTLCHRYHRTRRWSRDFIGKNTAKGLATVASMAWNFCGYKFFVYVS